MPDPTRPLVVVPVPPGSRVADVLPVGALPSSGRTLRIALAMRGGVSLAVWIGGVAAELDLLRRIRLHDVGDETWALVPITEPEPDPAVLDRIAVYARLLDRARYDRVEIDLLAGASAGGLNAVVYAVAQRAGIGLDRLLRTWGDVGGFWGLLHEPGAHGIRAPMRGEDYFRRRVEVELRNIHGGRQHHPDLVAEYVGVDLSATVIDAADEYEEEANEGRAHFRFVGDDHADGNGIPRRREPGETDAAQRADDRADLARLALAARSTSSLPGGFEPAEIVSTASRDGEPDVERRRDLRFAFSAHREQPAEPYRVVDGAVFDNVPIDRALRAARHRPALRLSDRVMLFIDPDPDPPLGGSPPWDPDASRFGQAVAAMLRRSVRRETAASEAASVQRYNASRLVEAGRRAASAPLVADLWWTGEAVALRRAAYVRSLGPRLAEHLGDALSSPSEWQLQASTPRRHRFRAIPRVQLAGLARHALDAADAAADRHPESAARSPVALADAANCVLAWVREIEALPDAADSRRTVALTGPRRVGYAVLAEAVGAAERATEAVLLAARDRQERRDGAAPGDLALAEWVGLWHRVGAESDLAAAWRRLDEVVGELVEHSRKVDAVVDALDPDAAAAWRRSAWAPLGRSRVSLRAEHLPPVASASGIPIALSQVRYWSISVDEEPAAAGDYRVLTDDRWRTRLQQALRSTASPAVAADRLSAPELVPLDRQTKLAGYGLGNFLGFLARDWRVNDWWWGRLDGAAGAVRLLATLGASPRADEDVRDVQDAVLAEAEEPRYVEAGLSFLAPDAAADGAERRAPEPADGAAPDGAAPDGAAPGDPRAADPATRRRARVRVGTDTIWNLDPEYRFSLASRAVRVMGRVLVPANGILAWVVHVVAALLRPLLALLPAVADPPRLALVSGIVAGVAWLVSWTVFEPTPGWTVVAFAVVAGFAIALGAGLGVVRRRWRRIGEALAPERRGLFAEARRWSRTPTWQTSVAALATLVPLGIAIARENVVMSILCVLVSVALVTAAITAATSARRPTTRYRAQRTSLMLGAFVAGGAVLPLVQLAAASELAWLRPPLEWAFVLVATGGLVAAAVLTVDWLPVRRGRLARLHGRGVNWVTVSLGAVLAGTAAWWLVWAVAFEVDDVPRTILAVLAFLVAWGNAVWWLPELRRREWTRVERIERAPWR